MNCKLIASTQGQGDFLGKTLEEIIIYCARVSSPRKDKFENIPLLINYCINNKHWSIFEQASMTIEIQTSRAIATHLLRHRSFTFQEFSQRYSTVNEIEKIELREKSIKNRQSSTKLLSSNHNFYAKVAQHIDNCKSLYNELLDSGVAKECARMILPMASSTTLYMTGTIRSWIHFLQIRDEAHSQKETQELAKEIKKIFIKECPIIAKALQWQQI